MAKGKKKANWVLIIAVMFILGGIMALIEKSRKAPTRLFLRCLSWSASWLLPSACS